jgi:hypothetical protein
MGNMVTYKCFDSENELPICIKQFRGSSTNNVIDCNISDHNQLVCMQSSNTLSYFANLYCKGKVVITMGDCFRMHCHRRRNYPSCSVGMMILSTEDLFGPDSSLIDPDWMILGDTDKVTAEHQSEDADACAAPSYKWMAALNSAQAFTTTVTCQDCDGTVKEDIMVGSVSSRTCEEPVDGVLTCNSTGTGGIVVQFTCPSGASSVSVECTGFVNMNSFVVSAIVDGTEVDVYITMPSITNPGEITQSYPGTCH